MNLQSECLSCDADCATQTLSDFEQALDLANRNMKKGRRRAQR